MLRFRRDADARSDPRREMLALLLRTESVELVDSFVNGVLVNEFTGSENRELVKASKLVGPERSQNALSKLIDYICRLFCGTRASINMER